MIRTEYVFPDLRLFGCVRRIYALLSALLVFSAGCAGERNGRIELDTPSRVNFGIYPAREKKTATYTIRNSGNAVLRIAKVRQSCPCGAIVCDKQELKPGEKATVAFSILPNSIFGRYSKSAFVESSDPTRRLMRLNVAGNAIPFVEVSPSRNVHAGRLPLKKRWLQAFELKTANPEVRFGPVKTQSNYAVTTALTPVGVKTPRSYMLEVMLTPPSKPGELRCAIRIPVLNPTNEPPVGITITGKIGWELVSTPGMALLPVSLSPVTRSFRLRLLGLPWRDLKPGDLNLPKTKGVSFETRQGNYNNEIVLLATFSPEFTQKLAKEKEILLAVGAQNIPPLRIVCRTSR